MIRHIDARYLFSGIVMKDIKYGVHIYTIELLPRFYCNALLYECLLTGRLHHTPGQLCNSFYCNDSDYFAPVVIGPIRSTYDTYF